MDGPARPVTGAPRGVLLSLVEAAGARRLGRCARTPRGTGAAAETGKRGGEARQTPRGLARALPPPSCVVVKLKQAAGAAWPPALREREKLKILRSSPLRYAHGLLPKPPLQALIKQVKSAVCVFSLLGALITRYERSLVGLRSVCEVRKVRTRLTSQEAVKR